MQQFLSYLLPRSWLKTVFYSWGTACSTAYGYISNAPFSATLILPNLYLGNLYDACHAPPDVTHIVSAVIGGQVLRDKVACLYLPLMDDEEEDLLPHLTQVITFIEKARASGGTVLIHCMKGRSRSVSLLSSYLMQTQHLSCDEALQFIKEKRPMVQPNPSFVKQLHDFEKSLASHSPSLGPLATYPTGC